MPRSFANPNFGGTSTATLVADLGKSFLNSRNTRGYREAVEDKMRLDNMLTRSRIDASDIAAEKGQMDLDVARQKQEQIAGLGEDIAGINFDATKTVPGISFDQMIYPSKYMPMGGQPMPAAEVAQAFSPEQTAAEALAAGAIGAVPGAPAMPPTPASDINPEDFRIQATEDREVRDPEAIQQNVSDALRNLMTQHGTLSGDQINNLYNQVQMALDVDTRYDEDPSVSAISPTARKSKATRDAEIRKRDDEMLKDQNKTSLDFEKEKKLKKVQARIDQKALAGKNLSIKEQGEASDLFVQYIQDYYPDLDVADSMFTSSDIGSRTMLTLKGLLLKTMREKNMDVPTASMHVLNAYSTNTENGWAIDGDITLKGNGALIASPVGTQMIRKDANGRHVIHEHRQAPVGGLKDAKGNVIRNPDGSVKYPEGTSYIANLNKKGGAITGAGKGAGKGTETDNDKGKKTMAQQFESVIENFPDIKGDSAIGGLDDPDRGLYDKAKRVFKDEFGKGLPSEKEAARDAARGKYSKAVEAHIEKMRNAARVAEEGVIMNLKTQEDRMEARERMERLVRIQIHKLDIEHNKREELVEEILGYKV